MMKNLKSPQHGRWPMAAGPEVVTVECSVRPDQNVAEDRASLPFIIMLFILYPFGITY